MQTEISHFINYITVEQGLASNTQSAYRRDLEKFAKFLERPEGLSFLWSPGTWYRRSSSEMQNRKLNPRTVARGSCHSSQFFSVFGFRSGPYLKTLV